MYAPNEISSECNHSTIVREENDHIYDALFEILMRVDPRDLFRCILVSKDWLSVITNPVFRKNYLNAWKNSSSIVVGLLLDKSWRMEFSPGCPGVQLMATSNLGRSMIARNSVMKNAFFVSKSFRGGLLLFCAAFRDKSYHRKAISNKFYVCKPISGGPPDELPPPPLGRGRSYMANILCDDDDGEDYRVVLAKGDFLLDGEADEDHILSHIVNIQIYCSWTGIWEQSTLTTEQNSLQLRLGGHTKGGIVAKGGNAIYWELDHYPNHCLGGWDMNGDYVSMIPKPPVRGVFDLFICKTTYGVSPQPPGSLLAATWWILCSEGRNFDDAWESEEFKISILALDDDKKVWDLLHSVRHASIWNNNLPLLTTLFGVTCRKREFGFVSFIPAKSDSVFLSFRLLLFVYHFTTGKLEHVDYSGYGKSDLPCFADWRITSHPLTMLDLGIWPSSPPSLQLPHCS